MKEEESPIPQRSYTVTDPLCKSGGKSTHRGAGFLGRSMLSEQQPSQLRRPRTPVREKSTGGELQGGRLEGKRKFRRVEKGV